MFDCVPTDLETPADVLARFREAPTLRDLPVLLRHKEVWPPAFGPWDYSTGDRCAIGLVRMILEDHDGERANRLGRRHLWQLWRPESHTFVKSYDMGRLFGLSDEDENAIFFAAKCADGGSMRDAQPEDVADAIDRYLAAAP
jgi:hypothetical protein